MALERLRRSDATGEEIPVGTGARVRVVFNDRTRTDLRADLTDEEVERLMPFVKEVTIRPDRRGPKKPKGRK